MNVRWRKCELNGNLPLRGAFKGKTLIPGFTVVLWWWVSYVGGGDMKAVQSMFGPSRYDKILRPHTPEFSTRNKSRGSSLRR